MNYTAGSPLRTVVSRFTADAGFVRVDPKSESKIIEIGQPFTTTTAARSASGRTACSTWHGRRRHANDPQGNAQKPDALLGKMLRIDVGGTSNGRAYRDSAGQPVRRPAGHARGDLDLRHAQPVALHIRPPDGTLWAGDVGQSAREEVDVIKKGANYGWNVMEGANCRQANSCDKSRFEPPVIDYPTADGNCAVVGGFVYRGEAIAALRGAYVYGDYCSGKVWALRYDGSKVTEQTQIGAVGGPMSSFLKTAAASYTRWVSATAAPSSSSCPDLPIRDINFTQPGQTEVGR